MKKILCYGDSNTWGSDALGGPRFEWSTRWPGVLREELAPHAEVQEGAIPGRTIGFDHPDAGEVLNGLKVLPSFLLSHRPLDLVIIMLGTNDVNQMYSPTVELITDQLGKMIDMVKNDAFHGGEKAPLILIICPPPVVTPDAPITHDHHLATSQQLAKAYQTLCREKDTFFLDAGKIITTSKVDGIHYEKNDHLLLGKKVAEKVNEILTKS